MNSTAFSSRASAISASSSVASFSDVSASSSSGSHLASNTIFAADELDGVFRIGTSMDSTQIENDSHHARDTNVRRRRFISPSFATDGELSTFSEESNDGTDEPQESVNSARSFQPIGHNSRRHIIYPSRRQQSPLSIFRLPISGSKRQCDDMMTEDGDDQVKTAPSLCRANCICSSHDSNDDESTSSSSDESLDHVMSTPSSKRVCLSRKDSPSSYISLFSVSSPATIDYRGADSAIITPKNLEHPLASGRPLIES